MARGGTPSKDYIKTIWNFHASRYICPSCKRKGLTKNGNNGNFYCMYSRLGCGQIFKDWGEDIELIHAVNPQLKR